MHLQELWKILKENPAFDFIAKSSDHAKNKEFITRLILSTDVAKHFGNLAKLENMKKKG